MMKMQAKKIEGDSFDSHSLLSSTHKNMTNEKLKYMINNRQTFDLYNQVQDRMTDKKRQSKQPKERNERGDRPHD
jgi:hypothetical protein